MIKQNDLIFLEFELFIFYNMLSSLLSHPGIPRVTLCFCTGSYTATDALSHTGGDFMFLYRFVWSCDNFWTTFWISFIFGWIVGPDL